MKFAFFLVFLGIFLKVFFFIFIYNEDPSLKVPKLDSAYYLELAFNLKEGIWIPQPEKIFLLPPGYSYFLTIIPFKKGNYLNIYIFQIFLGVLTVFFIKKLGEKFFGKRAGYISAILYLLYGPSTFYETRILSESILNFFILLFFISFNSEKKIFQFISGVILGFLCILRQNILLFFLFLFIWIVLKERKKIIILFPALPFLLIIPIISFVGTGKFMGTSAQGGIALYMGNNPSSFGLFSDPIGLRGNIHEMAKQVQIYTEKTIGKSLTPFEINLYWFKNTLNWAKRYPFNFLNNIFLKIQRFLDNWEYGLNEQWIWGKPWITYFFPIPFAIIISGGILGLIFSIKSIRNAPFFTFFFSQLLVLLIFYPSSRHRFPLVPFLSLWAGFFFDRFISLNKKEKIFKILIFTLILIFSLIGVPDERRKPDPYILFNKGISFLEIGDLKKASYWIDKSIELNWEVPFFHLAKAKIYEIRGEKKREEFEKWFAFYLGASDVQLLNELAKISLERKNYKVAEKIFRRSVEEYPKSGASAINLSQVLYLQGKIEEARKWYEKGISLGGYPIKALEEKLKTK